MKNNLKSINNVPFITCLVILLLNDFYLKMEYHNWLTGKLSDFCGLFVFVSFWTAVIPNRKQAVHIATAILFIIWKSSSSEFFIEFFSQNLYPIQRVVDVTDLIAIAVLPIAYYHRPKSFNRLNPIPLAILTAFSFCATSVPVPTRVFEQPQYLLFKSGITNFESSEFRREYYVHNLDSLAIIDIREISLDRSAAIDDEYHKVQILKDVDLRFLRELTDGYRTPNTLRNYEKLRDSLTVENRTKITLELDSVTEHLEFQRNRLDGQFKRFSRDHRLILDGKFKHGIEDSVWTFYNHENAIISRKYFENGELIKTELFDNAIVKSELRFNTRSETIRNKYIILALLGILVTGIIFLLFLNFKNLKCKDNVRLSHFTKISLSLLLPLLTLILAKFFSSFIPNSYTTSFFGIFGEVVLVFAVLAPVYAFTFYVIKLKNWFDLFYYIFLFAIAIVFLEELSFLQSLT